METSSTRSLALRLSQARRLCPSLWRCCATLGLRRRVAALSLVRHVSPRNKAVSCHRTPKSRPHSLTSPVSLSLQSYSKTIISYTDIYPTISPPQSVLRPRPLGGLRAKEGGTGVPPVLALTPAPHRPPCTNTAPLPTIAAPPPFQNPPSCPRPQASM